VRADNFDGVGPLGGQQIIVGVLLAAPSFWHAVKAGRASPAPTDRRQGLPLEIAPSAQIVAYF